MNFDRHGVAERLARAGSVRADEEAGALLAASGDGAALEDLVARRLRGEPLEWVVGWASFAGRRFALDPGVYVPRPQSEELARRAIGARSGRTGGRVVDIGTGSGALAATISAAVPSAVVIGTDLDPGAVACARRNGVVAVRTDLADGLRSGSFDIVVSVAPYVPTDAIRFLPRDVQDFEPRLALDGGPDGLAVVRRVVAAAGQLLRPGGQLLVELGGEQVDALGPDLARLGFTATETWTDGDGDVRGLVSTRGATSSTGQ
ncbi:MAG TPA: HemK/PrmC family methyltransferase [Acidimicrobiales bacterium]|jgi:release factor glutamine methyltransferase|nr:HemK/PrmC family methyltransferase [Acidimicrobiales bacterium]